jgi:hypothetical protein
MFDRDRMTFWHGEGKGEEGSHLASQREGWTYTILISKKFRENESKCMEQPSSLVTIWSAGKRAEMLISRGVKRVPIPGKSCLAVSWKSTDVSEEQPCLLPASCWFIAWLTLQQGRAIAQAVSRWLPTAAARVRARVKSCGIFGIQSGTGVGFLRDLRFPLKIFISPFVPQSPSSITWGWYNRLVVAGVPSGLSLTP